MAATQRQSNQNSFDRRTIIVWAALMGSMTLVSGLLLALEPSTSVATPGPSASQVSPVDGIDADATFGGGGETSSLIQTSKPLTGDRWQAIVVHHSGEAEGSVASLEKRHRAAGYQGLGYHFVIGNGNGMDDGEVVTGFRWDEQLPGPHVHGGENDDWFNHYAVSICLIGDGDRAVPTARQMERLVELVNQLQQRLGLGPQRVLMNYQVSPATGPGVLFPAAGFRQQLVSVAGR